MRTRLPFVLGLATGLCCFMAGSPQVTSVQKKTPAKRKTRKPAPPPVSAAMRADAVQNVDRYLTESAEHTIEQPAALVPFFENLTRLRPERTVPVRIIPWADRHNA